MTSWQHSKILFNLLEKCAKLSHPISKSYQVEPLCLWKQHGDILTCHLKFLFSGFYFEFKLFKMFKFLDFLKLHSAIYIWRLIFKLSSYLLMLKKSISMFLCGHSQSRHLPLLSQFSEMMISFINKINDVVNSRKMEHFQSWINKSDSEYWNILILLHLFTFKSDQNHWDLIQELSITNGRSWIQIQSCQKRGRCSPQITVTLNITASASDVKCSNLTWTANSPSLPHPGTNTGTGTWSNDDT
jgi:hypothetical protein